MKAKITAILKAALGTIGISIVVFASAYLLNGSSTGMNLGYAWTPSSIDARMARDGMALGGPVINFMISATFTGCVAIIPFGLLIRREFQKISRQKAAA